MKLIRTALAALVLIASGAADAPGDALAHQRAALLSVHGPGWPRYEPTPTVQAIWFSVPTSAESLYVSVFDAGCGGAWDLRRGAWNTPVRYALVAAPASPDAGGVSADSIDRAPLVAVTVARGAPGDDAWRTIAAVLPRQGRIDGDRAVFVLVARALSGNDADRFAVTVSRTRAGLVPIDGAAMWAYDLTFRLGTPECCAAEVRFVPAPSVGTSAQPAGTPRCGEPLVRVTTADATDAEVWLDTPTRASLMVRTWTDGTPASWRFAARDASEVDGTWRVRALRVVPGYGDMFLRISTPDGRPLAASLPAVISGVTSRSLSTSRIGELGAPPVGVDRAPGRQRPVADMGWLPPAVAPGELVTLDGSRSVDPGGGITGWRWRFGDGDEAAGPCIEHRWATPGRYDVQLTVQGRDSDAVDADARTIVVNAAPVADPGPSRSVAPGDMVAFDGSRSHDPDGHIARFLWDFGDGSPRAEGVRARHAFALPRTYRVALEVTDDVCALNSTARAATLVRVNAPPVARIGEVPTGCDLVRTFDGRASRDPDGTIASYAWSFSDGGSAAGPVVTHAFRRPGRYTVTLTVTDDSGARNGREAVPATVVIASRPVANAGRDQAACTGEPILFSGENSRDPDGGPLRFVWNFGDGAIVEGAHVAHAFVRPGRYPVTLTVTNASGLTCNADTDTVLIRVGAPPTAVAGENRTACAGETITFDGTRSAAPAGQITSYQWSFGDGAAATGPMVTHAYAAAGAYNVTLTVTASRAGVCENVATDMITVAVNELPEAAFAAPPTAVVGETVTFDASPSEGRGAPITGYGWDLGDGTRTAGPVVEHAYRAAGEYTVRLEVTTDTPAGCRTAVLRQTIRILPRASPASPGAKVSP